MGGFSAKKISPLVDCTSVMVDNLIVFACNAGPSLPFQ